MLFAAIAAQYDVGKLVRLALSHACWCSVGMEEAPSAAAQVPARQGPPFRRTWDNSGAFRESASSSPKLLAKLSSSLHRESSPSRHQRSDSLASSVLPPEIVPAVPRKEMNFVPAMSSGR